MAQANLLLGFFWGSILFPNTENNIINVQYNILALYPTVQPSGLYQG